VELSFEDGLVATLNLDDIINNYDGVFEPLTDPAFFRKVSVNAELGTIAWPNGADICPDVLYSHASGKKFKKNSHVDCETLPVGATHLPQ